MSDSSKRAAPNLGSEGLDTTLLRPHLLPAPAPGEAPTWPSAPRDTLPPELAPGRPLAGRYTVLDFLGQGGMGLVLAAYDPGWIAAWRSSCYAPGGATPAAVETSGPAWRARPSPWRG